MKLPERQWKKILYLVLFVFDPLLPRLTYIFGQINVFDSSLNLLFFFF